MSAYGAYGYARHDFKYKRILRHYFTDTRIDRLNQTRQVRVLLGTEPSEVAFSGATKACGRSVQPSRSLRATRTGSSVRLVSAAGETLANCGDRLRASGGKKVKIAGYGTYRGALSVVASGSALNVVNDVELEDYVRGSVPAEVFPSWPSETLKSMAVAIRSIAVTTDVGGDGYELYSDTRTQLYKGVAVEAEPTDHAVKATRGEVVTYHGDPIQAVYFSASGGQTESGFLGAPEVPYLQSVNDPYDDYSPLHRWTLRFTQAEMDSRLGPFVDGHLRRIKVTERGDSPRINYARLIGSDGNSMIRGDTLRSALGLYDRWAHFDKQR
jgi:stage II sporulation protein D